MMYRRDFVKTLLFLSGATFYNYVSYGGGAKSEEQPALRVVIDELGIEFGCQIIIRMIGNYEYDSLAQSNFNKVVIDGELHWTRSRPEKEIFFLEPAKRIIDFARSNKMKIEAHHLIWGHQLPRWLLAEDKNKREELAETHIRHVMSSLRGHVDDWVVVNEIYGNYWNKGNYWVDGLSDYGEKFISKCFYAARESDINARLFWSDGVGAELAGEEKADFIFSQIKKFVKNGVPIDGIGFHLHLMMVGQLGDISRMTNKASRVKLIGQFKKNIERYRNLGLAVSVTEFDVSTLKIPGPDAVKREIQAEIYSEFLKESISAGVNSFSIFGVGDKFSWYRAIGKDNANALLFDYDQKPKPAYHEVYKVLYDLLMVQRMSSPV